jgi:hypothetical protein
MGLLLENSVENREKKLNKSSIVILGLLCLTVFAILIPVAQADVSIGLSASQGKPGSMISVTGLGFETGTVYVKFDGKTVGRTSSGMFGRINVGFTIPNVSPGTYTITAEGSAGSVASTTFTVVSQSYSSTQPPSTGLSSANIWLSPSQGPQNSQVVISGSGFSSGGPVSINFDSQTLASTSANSLGAINLAFYVPLTSIGTHTISALGEGGRRATATFTVTQGFSSIITSTSPTSNSTQNAGFWSTTTIAIALLLGAVAIVVPLTFLYRRRGKKETLLSAEPPTYKPSEMPPPSRYPTPTHYHQPYEPKSRYNQNSVTQRPRPYYGPTRETYPKPSRYNIPQPSTKICKHCKQVVREDYSICPNCHKRLR